MKKLFYPWILANRDGSEKLYKGEKLNGYDFEVSEGDKFGLLVQWNVQSQVSRPSAYICDDVEDLRSLVEREEAKGRNLEFTVYKFL